MSTEMPYHQSHESFKHFMYHITATIFCQCKSALPTQWSHSPPPPSCSWSSNVCCVCFTQSNSTTKKKFTSGSPLPFPLYVQLFDKLLDLSVSPQQVDAFPDKNENYGQERKVCLLNLCLLNLELTLFPALYRLLFGAHS